MEITALIIAGDLGELGPLGPGEMWGEIPGEIPGDIAGEIPGEIPGDLSRLCSKLDMELIEVERLEVEPPEGIRVRSL